MKRILGLMFLVIAVALLCGFSTATARNNTQGVSVACYFEQITPLKGVTLAATLVAGDAIGTEPANFRKGSSLGYFAEIGSDRQYLTSYLFSDRLASSGIHHLPDIALG